MSQNDPWAQYATPVNDAPDLWAKYATPVEAQSKQKQWSDMTLQERTQLVAQRKPLTTSQFQTAQPQPADYATGFLGGAKDAATTGLLSPQALSRIGGPTGMLMGGQAGGSAQNPLVQAESEMTSPASIATQAAMGPLTKAVGSLLPSAERAGKVLGWLKDVHGSVPIDTSEVIPSAKAAESLVRVYGRGAMPQPLARFIQFATKNVPTFEDGREFATSVGEYLSDPASFKRPSLRRAVSGFANALATANRNALPADVQPLFDQAMKEYGQAKGLQDMAKIAKKYGRMAAFGVAARAGWGTAGKAASEIVGP